MMNNKNTTGIKINRWVSIIPKNKDIDNQIIKNRKNKKNKRNKKSKKNQKKVNESKLKRSHDIILLFKCYLI